MTIHIGIDTGCNLGCDYCYEEPDRQQSGNHIKKKYDLNAIFERLDEWREKYSETPGMHGGEPLLIPIEDLDKIYTYINKHWDGNSKIQTNGTLITEDHVDLFKKHKVNVGISCDGPDELNQLRQARGEMEDGAPKDITDTMTQRTMNNIIECREAGLHVGVIVVLHEMNAGTDERLDKLLEWMDTLNQHGIYGHFNPAIPYSNIQQDKSLSPERLKEVFLKTWEWMKEKDYRKWDPMRSYQDNLIGAGVTDCVNGKCDVYNAGAAKIVMGDGESTGCGKTWEAVGDGVPFLQGDSTNNEYNNGEERYDMLKQVSMEEGGCKGCDYWNVCQGGCPSSGIDEDYRNRTVWCEAKYALYEKIEEDMRTIFPNITLITDLPWDADLADAASTWQLDIKPFAAMDPGEPGRSSIAHGYSHGYGMPSDRVPAELLPEKSWEEIKDEYQERYDDDVLTFDEETGDIHADSDMGVWEEVEDEN